MKTDVYMTVEQAEGIVFANAAGMFRGTQSELAHAVLLMANATRIDEWDIEVRHENGVTAMSNPIEAAYQSTADQLRDRIVELIPAHHEILDMTDCWKLFEVEGFQCSDLGPSMAQASWALSAAKQKYLAAAKAGA